jgi:predicted LPLAT superfamily acyltransferase
MRPLNVVMHARNAAPAARTLSRIAPELAARVIAPGRPETVLRVTECLGRGEIVGLLGDRPFGAAKTHAYGFLGARATFPLGPLLIAAASGAPVVTFFGLYEGGARYRIRFEALTEGSAVPRPAREAWAVAHMRRYVERLEACARSAPYNWFNFYDFWDERSG